MFASWRVGTVANLLLHCDIEKYESGFDGCCRRLCSGRENESRLQVPSGIEDIIALRILEWIVSLGVVDSRLLENAPHSESAGRKSSRR